MVSFPQRVRKIKNVVGGVRKQNKDSVSWLSTILNLVGEKKKSQTCQLCSFLSGSADPMPFSIKFKGKNFTLTNLALLLSCLIVELSI